MHRTVRNRLFCFVLGIYALLAAGRLFAQENSGAISGTVTDPSGAVVPNAEVVITNEGTGVSRALTTDKKGFYSAEGLYVGRYEVDVRRPGFQENIVRAIQIDPGQRRANNVTLRVSKAASQVVITANAVQVNTESSDNGGTITAKQISNLMLNGRNFQTLAITVPGVQSVTAADSLTGNGINATNTIIVNGNSVEYTQYTIDGIYDMNSGNYSNIDVQPIVDGIAEFTVLKDNYSAKYGFTGSGQILVSTKSGTNTFHGSAWDYLRNNAFDADNYFSTSTPPLHQNIYGFTLGGPVIIPGIYNTDRSKKTFFFAANQWYAISNGEVERGAVLTQSMRNGDFRASPTLPSSGSLSLDASSQALLASRGLNPATCLAVGSNGGLNQINATCFDPVAVAIMNAKMPLPNNPGGGFLNYINEEPQTTSQLDYQYRVDHQINTDNQLMVRVLYEPVTFNFPYSSGAPYTTIKTEDYTTGFNGVVRLMSTIRPNLLNIAGVAETYTKPRQYALGATMPEGISIVQSFPGADPYNRIPNVGINGGWSGYGVGSLPITASDGEGLMSDDISWVKGYHVFQAGALYMFGIKRQNVFTTPQGSFFFSGVHTGDPAADYLLGLDASYNQENSQREGSFHYRQGETYVQDDWRAMPRLTLNLGLRYVYFSNDTVSGDRVSNFDPALYDPSQAPVVNINGSFQLNSQGQPITSSGSVANLLNGIVYAGQNGVPSGFFTPIKTNFGPRVGFAWDLYGNGKTALRGGYGIGYTRIPLNQIYGAFGQNPPYNLSANITNSLLSNGTAGQPVAPTPQTLTVVPFKFTPSQIQSYSLTLEQQVTRGMVAHIAYAGSQGRHLGTFGWNLNFPLPVTAPSAPGCLAPGQLPSDHYDYDPCTNVGISSGNYTSPYRGYATMNAEYDDGTSNYNALQAGVVYMAGSSQFTLAYTWGKTLTTINGGAGVGPGDGKSDGDYPQNHRDFHAEYGPPLYDFTNNITATWVYPIPFFKHGSKFKTYTLGNWNFSGLMVRQSGFALNPYDNLPTYGEGVRPDQVQVPYKVGTLAEWFNTNAYAQPPFGFFGNAKNGSLRGPAYTSFNVSLGKNIPITERIHAQLLAEAFNVLNHPNFENVDTGLGDGSFGQIISAGDPRILEFAAKVTF